MPPAPPRRTTSLLPPPSSSGLPSSGSHRAQLLGGFDASLMLHDHPMKAIGGVLCASGGEPLPVGSRDLGFHELPPSADRTSRVGSTQPIRLVPHRVFAAAPPSSARRAAIGSRRHVHRPPLRGNYKKPNSGPAGSRLLRRPGGQLLLGRRDVRYRQIPVGEQYLEAALFLSPVGDLVRPGLLDSGRLLGAGRGRQGRVLESDGHAIIPARVFSHVV